LASNLTNGQAGDFTAGANQNVICDVTGALKSAKGCPASAPVEFIEHSFNQPPASSTPYTFTWTPPTTNVGDVHFYVAGKAVNNDDLAAAGDHVYTNSYVLTYATHPPPPAIFAGGVLNAASYAKDAQGKASRV